MEKSKNRQKKRKNKFSNPLLSSASYRSNLDNIKLLVSDDDFQQTIREIRNKFEIPVIGFGDSNQQIKEWTDKMNKKADTDLESKHFLDQEKFIREKVQRKKISSEIANQEFELLCDVCHPITWHNLTRSIEFVISKFDLPVHYENNIRRYILFNEVDAPPTNFDIGCYPSGNRMMQARLLPINIYTKLTKREVKDLKFFIEKENKKLPRYQPLKNIDRNLEIEEWDRDREKEDLVNDESYKLNNSEIAENLLGSKKKAKQVYEIIRAQRELRNRRFRKFGKQ